MPVFTLFASPVLLASHVLVLMLLCLEATPHAIARVMDVGT